MFIITSYFKQICTTYKIQIELSSFDKIKIKIAAKKDVDIPNHNRQNDMIPRTLGFFLLL